MGKMNVLVHLNAYKDSMASNNPSLNNFKWTRQLEGLEADKAQSIEFSLAPGESRILFNGQRALSNDNTSVFDVDQKAGSSVNTYVLTSIGGSAPQFRTSRTIGSDATTEVTVSTVGELTTFKATGGTVYSMTSVSVGDEVLVGPVFNAGNQGKFKILAKTSDSFTVSNANGTAETSIVLGSGYEDEIRIFSSSGVQVGDKLKIGNGFSDIAQNTYEITAVTDISVEFYSSPTLPPETGIVGPNITVYSDAKKLVYLETDKKIDLEINNVLESGVEPFIEAASYLPGVFLKRSTVWQMEVTNNGTEMATLYFASIE
jgi:hypothetical protein